MLFRSVLSDDVIQRITDTGAQVSIENGEICVVSGLHYGTQVVFDVQKGVTISNDSKYYNKGFRVSGEDNSSSKLANPSITVTEDQDYVMAYGIQGETVAYTVNYLDGDGNVLFPPATYYGNVGDKPVVAYQYVEGWQPQAYNLGKTLVADASQNVFDFIYTPVPTEVTTNTVVVPGQPAPEGAAPEGTVPEVPAPPALEEPVPAEEDIPDEDTPTDDGPADYRDLDEPDTPTDNYEGDRDGDGEEGMVTSIIEDLATPLALLPTPAKVGIVSAVVLLAGAGICLAVAALRKGKKKNEQ